MIRAVVFDMDGVLFDTERISVECCFEAAGARGIVLSREAVYGCFGLNGAKTKEHMIRSMESVYPNGSFPYDRFQDAYQECYTRRLEQGVPVMPGVEELLAFLRKKGLRTAIASSTRQERVIENLEKNGMRDCFDVVVGGDRVERSKPFPDIYQLACRKLGVACAEAAAVEDSPNGIRSAKAAGMLAVMVPDMIRPGPELEGVYDLKFESLSSLQAYLERVLA